jgi:hypothetical protein
LIPSCGEDFPTTKTFLPPSIILIWGNNDTKKKKLNTQQQLPKRTKTLLLAGRE